MYTIEHLPKVDDLLAMAREWPLELELNCNLPLSLALRLAKQGCDLPYLSLLRNAEQICGLIVLTPRELLLSGIPKAAAEELAADLERHVESLPGMHGPLESTPRLAELWAAQRGVETKITMGNFFYALHELIPPAPMPPGQARIARGEDHELVSEWLEGFIRDADLPAVDFSRAAAELIATGDVILWLDGEPISMAAISGRTPRGGRVGYVYTPPAKRGRGFGAAATAAATRHALQSGAESCCLFADINNALTNRLYQRLGFVRLHETIEISFA